MYGRMEIAVMTKIAKKRFMIERTVLGKRQNGF
jgi:hypothetical protein